MPALQQMVRSSDNLLARFHALWTLEGLGALDAPLVRESDEGQEAADARAGDPRERDALQGGRQVARGRLPRADEGRRITNVVIQAMLTANLFKLPDAPDVIKAAQAANKAKGVALVGERLLAPATSTFGGGRRGPLTPDEEKRLQQGSDVFGAVCFACHGPDGTGAGRWTGRQPAR